MSEQPIKLSCCEYSFAAIESWERAVELVASLGFDGLNLTLMEVTEFVPLRQSHLTLDDVLADTARYRKRIDAQMAATGLELHHVHIVPPAEFAPICQTSPAAQIRAREHYRALVHMAAELGVPAFTIPAGPPQGMTSDLMAEAAEELAWRSEYARSQGVLMTIEPHTGAIAGTPQSVKRICELVPDLRLTLDYSHLILQGFSNEELHPLLPYAALLHGRGGSKGLMQVPQSQDNIDWEEIVRRLLLQGYEGWIQLEYVFIQGCPWPFDHLDNVDVITETVMLRQRLLDAIASAGRAAR